MPAIVDAHQHFWDLSRFSQDWLDIPAHAPIRRSFLPDDLAGDLAACGVGRSVFVQTKHDVAENAWALGLADRHDWIAGVVGWVDLTAADCAQQLAGFRRHRKAVGIRHVVQDESVDFLARPDVRRGLGVLAAARCPYDLLLFPPQLRSAIDVAAALPDLPLVLDHLAKPALRTRRGLAQWETDLRALADRPNVVAKLSGLVTEADWALWTVDDLRECVAIALDAFGPRRLMFGSDWPVCQLASGYHRWFATIGDLITPLTADERARILGGTAIAFYGLDGTAPRSSD